ncbi:MAG: VOC family protein [Candidatus Dormiibacterota bacterium]
MTTIDHVLLATTDLQHGEEQLWRGYGLRCTPGGSHLSWGTANLIVPIGGQYLELVAVRELELAGASLLGRAVLAAADRDRLTPIGVCLRTNDLASVAGRLGREAEPGSRTLADGSEVRWQSIGLEQAFGATRLPFYLSWEDGSQHPSAATPGHRIAAREIAEVEVGGREEVLLEHLGGEVPGLRPVGGAPGVRSLTLRLDDGSQLQLP